MAQLFVVLLSTSADISRVTAGTTGTDGRMCMYSLIPNQKPEWASRRAPWGFEQLLERGRHAAATAAPTAATTAATS
jgi:hypothetical protein